MRTTTCGVGFPEAKLMRAPHAVDNDYWAQNDKRYAGPRQWLGAKKLGIPSDDAPIVGFAGKLEPLKQVGPLMRSRAIQTPSVHISSSLDLGPWKKPLKEQASGSTRIHFLGFVNQSEMPVFYRLVDVLALVSYSETWGLCINEALASGARCFLSDRVGCHPDVLSVASRGALAPWNSPQEWSVVMGKLLNAPSLTNVEREAFNADFNMGHFHRAIQTAFAS